MQPLIAPLNGEQERRVRPKPNRRRAGGRTALEVLALLTQFPNPDDGKPVSIVPRRAQKAAYALVRKSFSRPLRHSPRRTQTFELEFNRYKQLGFLPADKDKGGRKPLASVASDPVKVAAADRGRETPRGIDGGVAGNHFPPRLLALRWPPRDEPVAPGTAGPHHQAGVGQRRDREPTHGTNLRTCARRCIKLTTRDSTLDIPIYILPGQADFSIALPFGQYGEMRIEHVPNGGGFNVYPLSHIQARCTCVAGAKLEKTGQRDDLVTTQEHGVIPEGREIVVEITP